MRSLLSCHSLLLCPLLLATLLAYTQQRYQDTLRPRQDTVRPRQDTLQPRRDTLLLHFAVDRYDIQPADAAQAARLFHDTTFGAKNIDSVLITGYTDKTGSVAHNRGLSGQRATAAFGWMQAQLSDRDTLRWRLSDCFRWRAVPGGIAPTPERTDSDNRRAEVVIHYHPDAPRPADTATALHRDSTQPSVVISLQHINFIVDTPVPTDATQHILPGYVDALRKYADRRMEIDGYCNSIVPLSGPDDPLFKLSVKRAKFIYDYLVNAGFDPARLTYKGMGNASPINSDPVTRQEMDANMRVEIKVF
jgi:outer membrane protein OmpA-like peptidoglycan-associated protein